MRSVPFPIFVAIFSMYTILLLVCTRQKSQNSFSLIHPRSRLQREEVVEYENTKQRASNPRIGIVEVLEANTSPEQYATAISSVICYAKIHGYDFHLINDREYQQQCPQDDKFFRRHCVVAHMLERYDYVLFLDSDIGVLNPERRIEEFLDRHVDIIFYDRFYIWEVMAGSYLVKNSVWSQHFLLDFANYSSRLSKNIYAADNGALHAFLAEQILPANNSEFPTCLRIFDNVKGYGDLFLHEVCVRKLLGYGTSFGRIKILHKGTGWARDPRMTNSKWSKERDFMFHNMKEKTKIQYTSTPIPVVADPSSDWPNWYNPFVGKLDLSLCTPGNTTWNMDANLIESKQVIEARLKEYEQKVENMRETFLAYLTLLTDLWLHEARNESLKMTLKPLNQSWHAYAI
ncbi:hypothetical protein ANCCAN_04215 [Ancylostoma caninum]|uniref:Nucleotide-diphospho-sugar transferase domain-containing protein n=1 Tax=Ancylostoma caninum TaxID=29170 RepID=A0A368H1W6_ANCCA|nr:hypothetical protein ANCCAN_04215 [Ancylostoma caninum]